jgi:hypothetical protein
MSAFFTLCTDAQLTTPWLVIYGLDRRMVFESRHDSCLRCANTRTRNARGHLMMFQTVSRIALALAATGAIATISLAPRDVTAAFIVGPADACLIPVGGDCSVSNLFTQSSSNTALGPTDNADPDFIGARLDTDRGYTANLTNALPGTSDTYLDLFIAPPGLFVPPIVGPLTWIFDLEAGAGTVVDEDIVGVTEVPGGLTGFTALSVNLLSPSSFSVTTGFGTFTTGIGARLRIDTGPATSSPVSVPGTLGLALLGMLGAIGRRARTRHL